MNLNFPWSPGDRLFYQDLWNRPGSKSWSIVTTTALSVILGLGAVYLTKSYLSAKREPEDDVPAASSDHAILKNHSTIKQYKTNRAKYPSIRTFYHPHAHAEKLQAIADLPLLVFVHGLGGSLPQFAPLLASLVNIGPCFGIELPGHGISAFSPKSYDAYTIAAFQDLWRVAIEEVCRDRGHKKVILIGHSMGCSLAALLTTSQSSIIEVEGLIGICPKATPPSVSEAASARKFLSLPDPVLNVLRMLDRRGGLNSKSVERMAGKAAGVDLRRLQLAFNRGFRTPVWKRSALGCLPQYDADGKAAGGLPGQETWAKINVPLFLIAGEGDTVTKPGEVAKILSFLERSTHQASDGVLASNAIPADTATSNTSHATPSTADERKHGLVPTTAEASTHSSNIVKTAILPNPAAHALMYDHSTYRTVAGLIEDFLARYVSSQLSLGWQLQQLTTTGKWDVKNLEKWKKVLPVSGPIGHPPDQGIFRAMKTLREQDEQHTPSVFIDQYHDNVFAVIDISHDSPVYDTKALERGGIQYHKFPTVSKVPPTVIEVADFIALVDRLRLEAPPGKLIGVHCHYGYNRTGFFICCYLIEKCGYRAQDALEEFARQKPPGIKHEHFIDTLWMRYHVGLKKAPTMLGTDSRKGSLIGGESVGSYDS
jgi:pimeloyl-ACP methyl ester carboxylesterase/protein-tyrosine phosphatase